MFSVVAKVPYQELYYLCKFFLVLPGITLVFAVLYETLLITLYLLLFNLYQLYFIYNKWLLYHIIGKVYQFNTFLGNHK